MQWQRAGRPIVAGVLLASVELAVIVRGGGRVLLSGFGNTMQTVAASYAICICLAFGAWAIGSWLARWAGATGAATENDPGRAEQVSGIFAGILATALATWMLWGLTEESSFRGPGARYALVLVVAPLGGFFVGWAVSRITASVRKEGGAWPWAVATGVALPVLLVLDAVWVPALYPEVHLSLSIASVVAASLFAACLPAVQADGKARQIGLAFSAVVVVVGLLSIPQIRSEPDRLAAIERHAPITGKVVRSLTRRPSE